MSTEQDWRAAIAEQVRRNCTIDSETVQKGGDALIYAVCDWIENPPEWSAFRSPQAEPIPAGRLTSGDVGKTIRVTVSAHVTIEDELEVVAHIGEPAELKTMLVFKDTTPENMGNGTLGGLIAQLHPKSGFMVHDTEPVTVVIA